MDRWFSVVIKMSTEVVSSWVVSVVESFGPFTGTGFFIRLIKKAFLAVFTCIFAVGGALVGTIIGAMKGQTTETGFLRGSGIGAVAGAITAVQLLESLADGEPLSKVALLCSLVNGKVFMEWVSPAVLKAYQWQISALETTYGEISDIYDTSGMRGLPKDCIEKLPQFKFQSINNPQQCHEHELSCSICLQDFKDGEPMRKLRCCGHFFHMECADKWLTQSGSCPMCRNYVCDQTTPIL